MIQRPGQGAVGGDLARQRPVAPGQQVPERPQFPIGIEVSGHGLGPVEGDAERIGRGLRGQVEIDVGLQAIAVAGIGAHMHAGVRQTDRQGRRQGLVDRGVPTAGVLELRVQPPRQVRTGAAGRGRAADQADIVVRQALEVDTAEAGVTVEPIPHGLAVDLHLPARHGRMDPEGVIGLPPANGRGLQQPEVRPPDPTAAAQGDFRPAGMGEQAAALELP